MELIALDARNPMTKVMLSIVIFEVVCCGLAVPVMINVDHLPLGTASIAGGGVAVLALLSTATLRKPAIGFPLGWLTQIGAVLLGLLSPGMWFVGGLFAALWIICFVLGKRLARLNGEREQAVTSS